MMSFALLAMPVGLVFAATTQVKPKPAKPKETAAAPVAKPQNHTVEVKLETDHRGCRIVSPKCNDEINDARRGDLVRFNFKNACPMAVTLRVGRFQPAYLGDKDAGTPLEPACLQIVSLKSGDSRVIQCRVKQTAAVNRTYKYSISSGKFVLLDPQIEIVP